MTAHPDETDVTRVVRHKPKCYLRGISGETAQKTFPLYGETKIGRSSDCHITLQHSDISRHHATISIAGDGFVVSDMDSSNGTFVNDERVREQAIKAGDVVAFGPQRFMFETSAPKARKVSKSSVREAPPLVTEKPVVSRGTTVQAFIWGLFMLMLVGAFIVFMNTL